MVKDVRKEAVTGVVNKGTGAPTKVGGWVEGKG